MPESNAPLNHNHVMTVVSKQVKLLHLEDISWDADQVARVLKKANIAVEIKVVASRLDYKNSLIEFNPDIIISDHSLPSFNSMEALLMLKQSALHIPFILVTGTVSEEFAIEAMREGADDYILKDRMQRLPTAVLSALTKYQLDRERRKIEEENRKLALIASVTVNAVIVTDVDGRITWINNGFERMTEYSFDEVIGKKPGAFLQGKETDPSTINYMRGCLANEQGFRIELLNYSKSGRKYWLDVEVMPLLDSQHHLTGYMAIEQDITERKKSEEETFNLIDSLQRKNNDLQQFSYIVSHNLRAHIAKILGLIGIMDSDQEENKELCKIIADEVTGLDNVVTDINTIVSARKTKEKMENIPFKEKLDEVKQMLKPQIQESDATITSDFSKAESISSVKSYLYSILYNLLSNAIKYRNPEKPLHVHLETVMDEKFICLSVKDNGRGIDLVKNEKKIFGLYKRFHEGSIPGKGLGLNMVKTHVESLGGRVDVESQPGEGTSFNIYIPKRPLTSEEV